MARVLPIMGLSAASVSRLTATPGWRARILSNEASAAVRRTNSSPRRSSSRARSKQNLPKWILPATGSLGAWVRRRMALIRSTSSRGSKGLDR